MALPGLARANSTTADLRALTGYRTYLTALSGESHTSASRDDQILSGVEADCPDALADANDLSPTQMDASAFSDFGVEVDADLAIAYLAPSRAALNAFAGSVTGLRWSTAGQAAITSRLITTERTLLNVPQSDLCADATTLEAAPLNEPTATATFLTRYRTASRRENAALKAFQTLVGRYETPAEAKLVAEINALVTQFASQSGAVEQADASAILSALGLSTS